jgi:rhomboid protease GluP
VRFEPVTGDDFVRADQLESWTSLHEDPERRWSTTYRRAGPPWAIALIAGVQIRYWWLVTSGDLSDVVDATLLSPSAVLEDGEVWRLWTKGFTHVAPLHIASNLGMLIYVGWFLERAIGRFNLVTIYFVSVFFGALASMSANPSGLSLGASGGVLGVVGAATVLGLVRHTVLPQRARWILGFALLPYLALVYGLGWFGENTDNWAHTGGLVAGALLGLLLDPPEIQRRTWWNPVVNSTVWGLTLAVALGLLLFGSTWLPTATASSTADSVSWTHPVTWRRSPEGPWYQSRHEQARTWIVSVRPLDVRVDAEREVADWLALQKEDGSQTSGPHPGVVAGQPAFWGERTDTAGLVEQRWMAGRGHYRLTATWSRPATDGDRLNPLRDRLISEIVWDEPDSLSRARRAWERDPQGGKARKEYAEELLRWGDTAQAVQLLRDLAAERPEAPEGWVGLLGALQEDQGQIGDPETLWDDALRATDHPEVVAEVALSLTERGRWEEAAGLLELSWIQAPGERSIRRARRQLGLCVELSGDTPAHLYSDPANGSPLLRPRRDPVDGPWTREQARPIGAEILAERRTLAARVTAAPWPEGSAALILLKRGISPPLSDLTDEVKALAEDLRSARGGQEVRWLPAELQSWALSRSDADLDALRSAATPPEGDPEPDRVRVAESVAAWLASLGWTQVEGEKPGVLKLR